MNALSLIYIQTEMIIYRESDKLESKINAHHRDKKIDITNCTRSFIALLYFLLTVKY